MAKQPTNSNDGRMVDWHDGFTMFFIQANQLINGDNGYANYCGEEISRINHESTSINDHPFANSTAP